MKPNVEQLRMFLESFLARKQLIGRLIWWNVFGVEEHIKWKALRLMID